MIDGHFIVGLFIDGHFIDGTFHRQDCMQNLLGLLANVNPVDTSDIEKYLLFCNELFLISEKF